MIGRRKLLVASGQLRQPDITEEYIGIATGFGLYPTLLIGFPGCLIEPLISQQMPLQQFQSPDDRAVPHAVAQGSQAFLEHADCALELTGDLQQLNTIDTEHRLVQQAAFQAGQLHALGVVMQRLLQLALGHRLL